MSSGDEVHKAAYRQIARRVIMDKSTLTYRVLAREIGISSAAAKEVLHAYLIDPANAERGLSPTWTLSGHLKPLDAMDVDLDPDNTPPEPSTPAASLSRHAVLLVSAASLEAKTAEFDPAPTRHLYSLSPSPLPSLLSLCASSLPSVPTTSSTKWKPAPTDGYGTIAHSGGERRRKLDKNKPKAVVASAKPVASGSTLAKKDSSTGSTKGSTSAAATEDKKPAVEVARPMGALKGLFADRNVVPAKRKATPAVKKVIKKEEPVVVVPKKKKVQNGIFEDDVDDSDDDEMDAEMEAMLALEDKKAAAAAAGKGKGKGKDAMDVDVKPTVKKPAPKAAPAPAKVDPKKGAVAAKPATTKPINSFFTKKS
ncbi:hypothetical protein RQP46_004502 [Phenoliferia psychrophenolica]